MRTLGWVEQGEGNLERALELFEQGATLCEQVGYTWIQASSLLGAAELLQELGRPEAAEERACEALGLTWQLVDRRSTAYALAFLAKLAAAQGDLVRAGRLWGAIEAEAVRAPLGNWEQERAEYEAAIVAPGDPEFEAARTAGRGLTLAEVVDYALAGRNKAAPTSR